MFPIVESHYVRQQCNWEFLPEHLSVREMHRLYREWCKENSLKSESYDFYLHVFKDRFNLKFNRPKKDVCDYCTSFKNMPEYLKSQEEIQKYTDHLEEKDRVRVLKAEMKQFAVKNALLSHVAVFDFQKTLLSPHGQTSSFYYSQRLRNYNFTITNIANMKTYCYLWNETEGKKGACEVATAVFNYLSEMNKQKLKSIHLFCDRCTGQNNNRVVVAMLSYAVESLDFEEISLNFLVIGHSQNENDNAHAVIERAVSNKTIYSTEQWETAIAMSFKKNEPVVEVLTNESFVDFKSNASFPQFSIM